MDFEEVDEPTGVKGRVSLELTLIRSRDRQVVFFERRQAEVGAEEKGWRAWLTPSTVLPSSF